MAEQQEQEETDKCEFWLPTQIMLIKSVEQLPLIYTRTLTEPTEAELAAAWAFVALETALPPCLCKLRWSYIRWCYFKIQLMMKNRSVTEQMIEYHPETRKYLDGNLRFLQPLVDKITDADIATHVHKRFDMMFQRQSSFEIVDSWLNTEEKPEKPHRHRREYPRRWPEHDVSFLNHQVRDMSLNNEGAIDDESPSTSTSGFGQGGQWQGTQGPGYVDFMCISSDSEDEE